LHITQVRENRAYLQSRRVEVPWNNKEFSIRWEHFTSKLQPGQHETWTLIVSPEREARNAEAKSSSLVAELCAALYDASLDQFVSHSWNRFGFYRQDYSHLRPRF